MQWPGSRARGAGRAGVDDAPRGRRRAQRRGLAAGDRVPRRRSRSWATGSTGSTTSTSTRSSPTCALRCTLGRAGRPDHRGNEPPVRCGRRGNDRLVRAAGAVLVRDLLGLDAVSVVRVGAGCGSVRSALDGGRAACHKAATGEGGILAKKMRLFCCVLDEVGAESRRSRAGQAGSRSSTSSHAVRRPATFSTGWHTHPGPLIVHSRGRRFKTEHLDRQGSRGGRAGGWAAGDSCAGCHLGHSFRPHSPSSLARG